MLSSVGGQLADERGDLAFEFVDAAIELADAVEQLATDRGDQPVQVVEPAATRSTTCWSLRPRAGT